MPSQVYRSICQYGYTLLLIGSAFLASAQQSDKWSGTWEMSYQPWPHIPEIHLTLRIAPPIANMLYPAQLSLTHGSFKGEYELLLVKKNDNQLSVGRNKVPLSEAPYGLGPWMMYLNGTLDYEQSGTGAHLQLNRLWIDRMGIFMSGLYQNEFYTNTKAFIRNFLYQEEVQLWQTDPTPHVFANQNSIISSDSIYYGVYDVIATDSPALAFAIHDEERYDQDTVTVVHNGRVLIDGLPLEQAVELDELMLDTGENYIAFFAENYGSLPPNTANFVIGTTGCDARLYAFDFSQRSNAFATVMVAPFRYTPLAKAELEDKKAETTNTAPTAVHSRALTAGRRDIQVGQWRINARKIDLEIRDAQVEDGDIISIEVNGSVVIDQETVTKNAKRFGITLKPGNNRIRFLAHNLGRIPPNTAVMSITADSEKKTFYLSTDFNRNNVLDIIVEN